MVNRELPGKGADYVGITTCFICHDGSGRVFMAKRSQNARDEKGTWEIGGGGLDFGVTAIDNTRREIEEEFAAKPKEIEFLGYRDIFRNLEDGTPTHWVGLDFLAFLDSAETRINEPHKFDDSGWFKSIDFPEPLHSQIRVTLSKYASQLTEHGIVLPNGFSKAYPQASLKHRHYRYDETSSFYCILNL